MVTRYIGDAVVKLQRTARDVYRGSIRVGKIRWDFDGLCTPLRRLGISYRSPAAYDRAAKDAVSFGSNYTTYNRGNEVPDGYPSAEIAEAISDAAWDRDERGDYIVRRKSIVPSDRSG